MAIIIYDFEHYYEVKIFLFSRFLSLNFSTKVNWLIHLVFNGQILHFTRWFFLIDNYIYTMRWCLSTYQCVLIEFTEQHRGEGHFFPKNHSYGHFCQAQPKLQIQLWLRLVLLSIPPKPPTHTRYWFFPLVSVSGIGIGYRWNTNYICVYVINTIRCRHAS